MSTSCKGIVTMVATLVLAAGCGSSSTTTLAPLTDVAISSTSTPVSPTETPVTEAAANAPIRDLISVDTADQVERLQTLSGHSDRVTALAFSGDGVYVASSSWDETIKLWGVRSGQEDHTFDTYEVGMNHIAFSLDGRLLASADAIWDVESKQVLCTLERDRQIPAAVAFSPDGSTLAVAFFNRAIKLWDVVSGQVLRTFEEQADPDTLSTGFR